MMWHMESTKNYLRNSFKKLNTKVALNYLKKLSFCPTSSTCGLATILIYIKWLPTYLSYLPLFGSNYVSSILWELWQFLTIFYSTFFFFSSSSSLSWRISKQSLIVQFEWWNVSPVQKKWLTSIVSNFLDWYRDKCEIIRRYRYKLSASTREFDQLNSNQLHFSGLCWV